MFASARFKVKSLYKEFNRWFYVLEHEGVEHRVKLFDFQKELPLPDEIECIMKEHPHNGSLVITQDLIPLIADRYKVGGLYKVRIRKSVDTKGLYELITPEAFIFHLYNPKNRDYVDGQEICCRIISIDGVRVNACEQISELSKIDSPITSVSLADILDMADEGGIAPVFLRWAKRLILLSPIFEEARALHAEKNILWIAEALSVLRTSIPRWIRQNISRDNQKLVLNEIRRICIEMVERSGLFSADTAEMHSIRWEIDETIYATNEYLQAIDKLVAGMGDTFANDIIISLGRTGHIYDARTRLGVLVSMFTLQDDLMERRMPEFIDTLTKGSFAIWREQPLCDALVFMLSRYVDHVSPAIDRILDPRLNDNSNRLAYAIRTLSMLLLLTSDEKNLEQKDVRNIWMSRLCRYASVINENFCRQLADRAFFFLFQPLPPILPFNWGDTMPSTQIISYKLAQMPLGLGQESTVYYEGKNAIISVSDNNIVLSPKGEYRGLSNALPADIVERRELKVLVTERPDDKVVKNPRDILELRRLWRMTEDYLFASPKKKPVKSLTAKRVVDVGDLVDVRVVARENRFDKTGNPIFSCVVVDDYLYGEGTLTIRDIVHYNVIRADVTDFYDDENRPLLIRCKVTDIDKSNKCVFSCVDFVGRFIGDTVVEGEKMLCRMTIKSAGGSLLVSEHGYSLKIPNSDDLPVLYNGEIVWVEITQVFPDGRINATFIDRADYEYKDLSDSACLRSLLRLYSEGKYYTPTVQKEESPDQNFEDKTRVTRAEILELINLVDRESSMCENRWEAFSYLAMARLLALAIADSQRTDNYLERMTLIAMMQEYAVNQQVDLREFSKICSRSIHMLAGNPDLHDHALRLICIALIDRPDADQQLTQISKENPNSLTGDIARLVLAYNLLKPYEIDEARRLIRLTINGKLNIANKETTLEYIGAEGPQVEFKASMVYPPENKMKVDRMKQTTKLLQVICGMMNSHGGKLYVGVNDQGYAIGLDNDFKELTGVANYDEQKARDIMDVYFRNNIHSRMPAEAQECISTNFIEYQYRTVYVVEVTPTPTVMSVDNSSYRRFGTSTHPMKETEIKSVQELKRKEQKNNR